MSKNLNRLAPLSGIVFVVVVLVAIFTSHSSPNAGASANSVISFYKAHSHSQLVSDILFVIGFSFFVLFAGVLRSALHRESEGAATTGLVGAAILAAGFGLLSVTDYTLADHPGQLTSATAQALNNLSNNSYPIAAGGALIFGIGAGIAVMNATVLPRWLGAVVLVLGIAAATPASIIGLLGLILWTLVVSILLLRPSRAAAFDRAAVPAPAAAG